jgi:hypothetical protein
MEDVLYHGTDGDSILNIIKTRQIRPNSEGEIYFSQWEWAPAMMHSREKKRKATFVIMVRVQIPKNAVRVPKATEGVRSTLVIQTKTPIEAEVLEMHVRRPGPDGFIFQHVKGLDAIRTALA